MVKILMKMSYVFASIASKIVDRLYSVSPVGRHSIAWSVRTIQSTSFHKHNSQLSQRGNSSIMMLLLFAGSLYLFNNKTSHTQPTRDRCGQPPTHHSYVSSNLTILLTIEQIYNTQYTPLFWYSPSRGLMRHLVSECTYIVRFAYKN